MQQHEGLILVMDLSDRSLLRIHRGCIDETACSEGTTDGAVPVAAVAVTGASTSANGTNTNLPRVLQIDSPGTAWVAVFRLRRCCPDPRLGCSSVAAALLWSLCHQTPVTLNPFETGGGLRATAFRSSHRMETVRKGSLLDHRRKQRLERLRVDNAIFELTVEM